MQAAAKRTPKSLVELLLESKLITQGQLQRALGQQREGRELNDILIAEGLVTQEQLAILTSLQLRVPFVDLKKRGVDAKAVAMVPETVCRKHTAVPVEVADGALVVAMADPSDIQAVDAMAALTKKRIEPVLALRQDIQLAIDASYRLSGEIYQQISQIPILAQGNKLAEEGSTSTDAIAQAPVVRVVDMLIRQGAKDRASDIHIEPQETHLRVRYRIDGILSEVMSLPLSAHAAVLSRIKIMASLNIAERRRPQDGQITFNVDNRELDIRVATSNTVYGEMAVLRILDKTFALYTLPELGFLPDSLEKYRRMLKTPFGMVLISGPTGSGKTTTLYASINQLDNVRSNVITIEDPVEYRFKDINQMQVNVAAGMTFATGLRAIMRLDPNVILVGEIRDSETARIAIQSALTGHLVLSSVHANDSVGVIYRLIDLGVEPFLGATAIIGIVAQRMVRRVCPNCAYLTTVSAEEQLAYEKEMEEQRSQFVYGAGCNSCAHTGYLGRTGIYEVMVISEALRRLILRGASSDDIRAQALREGLITLWHDGMTKVRTGITTPYEVIRNVFSIS
ncbi:MAG: type II/IV secretion system protein [Chloroflexi bacterium]|nr:type II/IV secretion system protein [Chloroflexota bacterium]